MGRGFQLRFMSFRLSSASFPDTASPLRGELAPRSTASRLPRFHRARPSTFLDIALWN